jgi:hypothetical protein
MKIEVVAKLFSGNTSSSFTVLERLMLRPVRDSLETSLTMKALPLEQCHDLFFTRYR